MKLLRERMEHTYLVERGLGSGAEWTRKLIDAVGDDGVVLDLGCGEGHLRKLFPDSAVYIGIDRYFGIRDDEYPGWNLRPNVVGDAYRVPLADGSVSAVAALSVIEHLSDPDQAFAEAFRVLRDGGSFFIDVPFMHQIHHAPNDYLRYTPFALRELARSAGFDVVEIRPSGGYARFIAYALRQAPKMIRAKGFAAQLIRTAICWPLALIGWCIDKLQYVIDMHDTRQELVCGYHTILRKSVTIERHVEPIKMAVVTQSISHFEVPLFRRASSQPELQIKVFYIEEVQQGQRHDPSYRQPIGWGDDLLSGYESMQCADAKALRACVAAWNADVVLMYGYSWPGAMRTIVSNSRRGVPQIHRGTLHHRPDPRAEWRSRLLRPVRQWLLRKFDAHHFGGQCSKRVLLDAGAIDASLFFVPYSVDSQWFLKRADRADNLAAARQIREACGWSSADRVLLFICQHSWIKGTDIALETFRQYRQRDSSARLLIVGSGVKTPKMQAYVQQHDLADCVHFAGFVPSLETVPYYLASNLVLCTSRYETWARMVNEAMLCAIPVVASDWVAASDDLILDGVTGYVTRSLEPTAFVAAIARYFALSPDAQQRMADAAKAMALKYSYEANMQNVLAAARHALKRRHP